MRQVWLDDGTAMQDRIPGDGFTPVRLARTRADTAALEEALRERGALLAVLNVRDPGAHAVCGVDLLLLRPDMHVAWRGNRPPDDATEIATVVTGH